MLLKLPKSACNMCRISPCREQKERLAVFMEREIIPRCFSTAVTASWGIFCTVLSLLPDGLPWTFILVQHHRLSPNLTPSFSQAIVHSSPLMNSPFFHTELQSILSQSQEKPYRSTISPLEFILSIFSLQCMHNSLQSSAPQVLPPSQPTCQSCHC